MSLASRIKASYKDAQNERKADALAMRVGKKKAKAEYRKELVKATTTEYRKKAKRVAKARVERRGSFAKGVKKQLAKNKTKNKDIYGGNLKSPFAINNK